MTFDREGRKLTGSSK
jgi:hypothetical protein